MKRRTRFAVAAGLVLAFAALQPAFAAKKKINAKLNGNFRLVPGQYAEIKRQDLKLEFVRFLDRPLAVECIVSGDGVGGEAHTIRIPITAVPQQANAYVRPYLVRLVGWENPSDDEAGEAVFRIQSDPSGPTGPLGPGTQND